ncbi:MAG: hypothetical protein IKW78_05590 [Prevotella sp.]|nr:hypothetical protein [Prevotella sp.]
MKKYYKILTLALLSLPLWGGLGWGLCSCSSHSSADKAARVAKQYYDYLLEGKYDAFVDGRYQPEAIPDSYREQLIKNAKMFMGQQQIEHRGIKETRIVNATADEKRHEANVFLTLCYGDSTVEEVCVPMVESDGIWYLR